MSPLRLWLVAARPRTLPAAVAPVLVGTALARTEGTFHGLRFACALVGSVFITFLESVVGTYTERHLFVLGLIFVVFVLFLPDGLVGLMRHVSERSRRPA